nr:hypothetical protein [Tanacetum cinerariifolium]
MYTLVFVDLESSTHVDEAQSSYVPVPLPEDIYEAIRTACKVVLVPPVMSPGLSTGIAEVAVTSDSVFCKRFSSSYDSSPSSTLPVWKKYRGTSKLIFGTNSEEDEERMRILLGGRGSCCEGRGPGLDDESYGLDDESYGLDYESYGLDDESYGLDDETRGIDDEGPRIESDRLGLGEEEAVPEGQQRAVLVVGTVVNEPLGFRSERVLVFRKPTLTTWTDPKDATLTATIPVDEDQFIEIDRDARELYTRSGEVRDKIFSQSYRFKSLKHEQEKTDVTFGALSRPVLALEARAGPDRFTMRATRDEGSCECVGAGGGS